MSDECPFCNLRPERIISESDFFYVIYDGFPVTPLHSLFIPIRHVESFFDLNDRELKDLPGVVGSQRQRILKEDESVSSGS